MPHTKAPFRKERAPATPAALDGYLITGADYTGIGLAFGGLGEEGEANARLFELSPQLLTALRSAYDYMNMTLRPCDPGCDCLLHEMKAVLNQVDAR